MLATRISTWSRFRNRPSFPASARRRMGTALAGCPALPSRRKAMERLHSRKAPKVGPSDSSDTTADRPGEPETDSDDGGTGERVTTGIDPLSKLHVEDGADRV